MLVEEFAPKHSGLPEGVLFDQVMEIARSKPA